MFIEWLYPLFSKRKTGIFVRILSICYLILVGSFFVIRSSEICNGFEQLFGAQIVLGFFGFLYKVKIKDTLDHLIIILNAFVFTILSGVVYLCGDIFAIFYFFVNQYKMSDEIIWMFIGMVFYLVLFILILYDRKIIR